MNSFKDKLYLADVGTRKYSVKKVYLKGLQKSQQNTCAPFSLFSILKGDSSTGVFLWVFQICFKDTYLKEYLRASTSDGEFFSWSVSKISKDF